MRKLIALFACATLGAGGLWLANLQLVVDAQQDAWETGPDRQLSARELLQQGELLYQRGRYDEAKRAFEAAAQAGGDLTAAERQRLDQFLNRPQLAGGFTPNNYQPTSAASFNQAQRNLANHPPADPNIVRRPIDDLMRQSYLAYQSRNLPEAIRLAQSADQMAAQLQVRYAPGERTPADVLAQLHKLQQRNPGQIQQVSNVRAQNGDVEWAESVSNQPQPAGPRSPKEQAAALVVQARRDLQSGRYEEARLRAMEAQQLNVTYELFEDQPQHILADLDRITGARTFNPHAATAQPGPQSQNAEAGQARALVAQARQALKAGHLEEAQAKAQEALKYNVSYDVFEDRPQSILADLQQMSVRQNLARNPGPQPTPGNGPRSTQAQSLLAEARQAMKAGDFAAAQAKAVQASQLGATYELFDDRPEQVLADIQRLNNSSAATQPGTVAQANPMQEQNTAQAKQLLSLARQDIARGQYEAARQKAQQAQQLRGAYGVFDDRPEVVLADVSRLERTQPAANIAQAQPAGLPSLENRQQALVLLREAREALAARQPAVAEQKALHAQQLNAAYDTFDDRPELVLAQISRAVPAQNNVVNASDPRTPSSLTPVSGNNAQEQARQLLTQARQEMQAGRFDTARTKAEAAAKLNVTYDVFDDTPQIVLAEIKQLAGKANPVAAPTELVANQENPFLSGTTAPGQEVQNTGDFAPISPNGTSARELYQLGLAKLNAGDTQGAYTSFQQAYASGQQLDPYTQQRLQDFLTELHPSRQLAKAQGTPENPAATVDQQQQILFDKLRTEVLNAVFRAERLRETNPDQSLEVLNRAQANVDNAQLDAQLKGQLSKQLDRTRKGIEAHIKLHQPNIDLKRRNEEILADIDRQAKKRIQVEQEFAKLVDEFNQLFNERRYAEAEVVAKQASDLDPENPVAVTMKWKARFAKRVALNDQVKDDKEVAYWQALHEVERDSAAFYGEPIQFPKNWQEITDRRKGKYGPDNRIRTEEEKRIEKSLGNRISLHFDDTPLAEVMRHISVVADVNVVLDDLGMQEVGVTSDQPVSINVDGIQLQSALKLLLEPLGLTYTIQHEVLKITSPLLEQGQLMNVTYPVADLVVPIPNFVNPSGGVGMAADGQVHNGFVQPGSQQQMSISPYGGLPQQLPGQVQAQVNPMMPNNAMNPALNSNPFAFNNGLNSGMTGGGAAIDYDTLMDLIISTVEPDSWTEVGGEGTVRPYNTTLSLVIRQTQKVHEEIADLLEQLRRLQDLQVTIEVRFVTVSDRFFERIGIDFDFNVQDTVGGPDGLPPFGSIDPDVINPDEDGMPFDMAPDRFLENRDSYRRPTVVGLNSDGTFSQDLDIPFRQGSFDIGVPDFGNFQPGAGLSVGMAILSDIEAFFFIEAAQGDERSNLLFAPKVTLFNGQQATVQSVVQRPFVTSLIPVVGFFAVGFQPQITVLSEGVTMQVQAVISADRRFVRLTVIPSFTNITDVFTFSFISGGQNVGALGIGQGQQGQGGGFGGGGFGGGFGGFGGIGGGPSPAFQLLKSPLLQQQGQGQNNQNQQGAGLEVTIQQPVFEVVSVTTTVSVPDGGTVLLGGVKRLREGRNMAGVPILNKIPYISRLFKNTGVGRETESLMMMVTPRIIIQEEEEELLGIPVE